MKEATCVFLVDGDRVLLGMKKRGFAAGKWNGFGGKRNDGESIDQTASRELQEESGMIALLLNKCAILDCHHPQWSQQVHVYTSSSWEGKPVESEEMRPKWFDFSEIPYNEMWDDAAIWLPRILAGEKLKAVLQFDEKGALVKQEISELMPVEL